MNLAFVYLSKPYLGILPSRTSILREQSFTSNMAGTPGMALAAALSADRLQNHLALSGRRGVLCQVRTQAPFSWLLVSNVTNSSNLLVSFHAYRLSESSSCRILLWPQLQNRLASTACSWTWRCRICPSMSQSKYARQRFRKASRRSSEYHINVEMASCKSSSMEEPWASCFLILLPKVRLCKRFVFLCMS